MQKSLDLFSCRFKPLFYHEHQRLESRTIRLQSRATVWIFNVKDEGVVSSSGPVKDVVILSKHTQSHVAAMQQLRHTNVKCPCDWRTHTQRRKGVGVCLAQSSSWEENRNSHTRLRLRTPCDVNSCTSYITMQGNGHKVVFILMNCITPA